MVEMECWNNGIMGQISEMLILLMVEILNPSFHHSIIPVFQLKSEAQ
jgi:hypothetical protein